MGVKTKVDNIEEVIESIRQGNPVIMVDDEDRENEGDLIVAGEFVTPEVINFMARFCRGLICVPCTEEKLLSLGIKPQVEYTRDNYRTDYQITVDAAHGITTGISAADRAHSIRTMANPNAKPADLVQPGHILPLRAKKGGVLQRAGHTEATVDLTRLAGLGPIGVICEIIQDDGKMARLPQLLEFAEKHNLKIGTVEDLIKYRRHREKLIQKVETVDLPTDYGNFTLTLYKILLDGAEHLALVKGDIHSKESVLVRVHSECLTGDVFGSRRCDCGSQLHRAMKRIEEEGCGVILYMRQEGRGIGLLALVDLGIKKIRLLTNNPKKIVGLQGYGITIEEQVPLRIEPTAESAHYLQVKKEKMGHLL